MMINNGVEPKVIEKMNEKEINSKFVTVMEAKKECERIESQFRK